jgi:Rne/Rng family ribonuclease
MLMKELIIDVGSRQTRVALLENKELTEIYIERQNNERITGNIYKGKVENVLPGMQAAFVDIGLDKNAFLYVKVALPNTYFDEDDENVDPVGACVGHKGMRVQTIVNELRGEKIDIVKWSSDPVKYIANALSPAKVVSVEVNEVEKVSKVIVPDYQLSLAIGKEGQNARLAAKLTGWKIDIKSESQAQAIM